jgi:hypothetical protein
MTGLLFYTKLLFLPLAYIIYSIALAPDAYHMLVSDRTQALGVVLEDWPQ